jgi:hypothetical protein
MVIITVTWKRVLFMKMCPETGQPCPYESYCSQLSRRMDVPSAYGPESINGQSLSELPLRVTTALLWESCVDRRIDALTRLVMSDREVDPETARVAETVAETLGYERTRVAP